MRARERERHFAIYGQPSRESAGIPSTSITREIARASQGSSATGGKKKLLVLEQPRLNLDTPNLEKRGDTRFDERVTRAAPRFVSICHLVADLSVGQLKPELKAVSKYRLSTGVVRYLKRGTLTDFCLKRVTISLDLP